MGQATATAQDNQRASGADGAGSRTSGGLALRFSNVVALSGGFPVLTGVDLQVQRGAICWLAGANGAGKTSILRVAAGLLQPASGTAEVLGMNLQSELASVRAAVGLLSHQSGMYEELSVAENLHFWGSACGAKQSEIAASLRRVEVSQRLESVPFAQLSSGQRRRVSLAAMLVRRATLWCLDEPHAGMDAPGRDLIDGLLLEARNSGVTTLIASHDADRVASLATDRVWVQGGAISAESGESRGQTATSNLDLAEP